jgi:hypothetical protein
MFVYEIIAFFLFAFSLSLLILRRQGSSLSVMCLSILTVFIGEALNDYFSTTTYYNGFLKIPGTGIPVFIICFGSLTALWSYLFCIKIKKMLRPKGTEFILCLVLSFLFPPISEFVGISAGLWKWNIYFNINFSFFVGVWKYYFIFIFLPVFYGLFTDKLRERKKAGKS